MSVIGTRQKGRLFLEGQEVPFKSAVITSRVGAPTTATLTLVPLNGIKKIVPRTQCQVFLVDTKNFIDNNPYLAFDGEILGRAYGKAQDNRYTQFIALDYSSYWDRVKAYVMNPNFVVGKVSDVVTLQDAPIGETVKANAGKAVQTSATANTRMIELILAGGNKDLAKGIVNVIKSIGGIGTTKGANQFFAAAFERLRINDRLALFTGGKVQTFLQDLKIDDFLRDFTGKFGGISDLRDMLYSVMALVYHDFVSIPFPAKIYGIPAADGSFSTQTSDAAHKPVPAPSPKNTSQTLVSQFFFIPDCYSLPAPMCNVIFPNQVRSYGFQEDFQASPTRYSFRASLPIMPNSTLTDPQYPTQFYPTAFSDYMFNNKKSILSATEKASLLGPSTLLTDPVTGNTYANVFYGISSKSAVGPTVGTVLREADYMSNEESLKGVYLASDTFIPSYTALTKGASPASRTAFIQGIGAYLFFKKRFSSRVVTAEILFDPFLVPGFNAIILDESDAGQSFTAKLQSVTQVIQDDGCATQIELAYGRDYDEVDELTGGSGEPPTPPWFDPNIFGISGTTVFDGKTALQYFQEETAYLQKIGAIGATEVAARAKITNPTAYPNLNAFYQSLLGCNAVTNYSAQSGLKSTKTPPLPKLVTTRGAVSWLLFQYGQVASNPESRDTKVQSLISRPMLNILEAFSFLRAQPVGFKNDGKFVLPEEFASFTGVTTGTLPGRFDGVDPNGKAYSDKGAIDARRKIIAPYVQQLKQQRGFIG